jgi:phytoene dehydrogenase-like protein
VNHRSKHTPGKRVIVIGSGIGGSAVAALLQHSGKASVDLFEKHAFVGGRYSSYMKDGFRLDVGCHLVANGDRGRLGDVLRLLGRPDAVAWGHARKPGPVFNFKGQRLKFPSEIGKIGFSGEEMARVVKFYMDVNSWDNGTYDRLDHEDLGGYLARNLDSQAMRSILGLLSGVYFVISDYDTPVGEWARCNKEVLQNRAQGYPIGGTGAIPRAYVSILEDEGGRVHLGTGVKRIIVEGGAATGVELEDSTVHPADVIISNAGNKETVDLVGREHYTPTVLATIDAYTYSMGVFALKVALDTEFVRDENMVMFVGEDFESFLNERGRRTAVPEVASHAMIPIISNMDPTSAPPGKQLIAMGGGLNGRPSDYSKQDWKDWEKAYLRALEIVFPGIGKHIMWSVANTPADIERQFGEEGCVIGISQKVGQVGSARPALADPCVRDLYHCSADSGLHGIGGELAADSALRLYGMLMREDTAGDS